MAELPTQSKTWIVQNRPVADVDLSDGPHATFKLTTVDIPSVIPDDSLLIKSVFLSNDPAQRGWIQKGIDPKRLYVPPVEEGQVMRSISIGRVIKVGGSGDTHKEGDLVNTSGGWSEYAVVKKSSSRVITPIPGTSPSIFLGALGGPGLTAYWGLVDILKLQAGETIIVSGAAGAVGNIAVQLAKKSLGAKVIAIVGSPEKGEYIKNLGADIALNYKSPTFKDDLIEATPDFVETYFDNVGGDILGLVLTRLKRYGRVAACGAISAYNDPSKSVIKNYFEVIANRLQIKGFVVLDYLHRPEGIEALIDAVKTGKLVTTGGETTVEVKGLEEVPRVWYRLFEGRNQGKLVTKFRE